MGVNRVLIANRGIAALRIVRTCREMGISSVVAYSEPDADSPAVLLADDRFCVGPGPAALSYLNMPAILETCAAVEADAVHPGWGFLSENADFADMCEQIGVVFIGPSAAVMRRLADKISARDLAARAGLPVSPGTGPLNDLTEALASARHLGYPLMLKAAAGGGGRGMAVIGDEADLVQHFDRTRVEAESLFLDDRVFLEGLVRGARHVEVQVLGDRAGTVVHLGERDCTVQRRRQKLLEESPSATLDDNVRQLICEGAVRAAQTAGYDSAGTFEFLVDRTGGVTFMEANTRLQVEHGITEERSGIDIVEWMIRIAGGEQLGFTQHQVRLEGHAIECRITAEAVDSDWAPSIGTVTFVQLPGGPGVRVDSDLVAGRPTLPFYDSLVAKIITRGDSRAQAVARMRRALAELRCEGVETTVGFHRWLLEHPDFLNDVHTTVFVDEQAQRAPGSGRSVEG